MPSNRLKTKKMISRVWILFFLELFGMSEAQTYESITNLRSTLLNSSYDTDVLPLNEQSETLNINLTSYVFMISEVDQVQGAITMGVMVTMEWYDERLHWTPADHGGIMSISVKSEDVWTPPLTVAYPVKFTMLDKSWMQVMIRNDGKATYIVGEVVMFSCTFYMKYWPFDKQVCSLQLFMYGYMASQITLSVPGTVVNSDYYSKNGEWFLDEDSFEYSIENFFGTSLCKYTFKIARLPSFYLLTVIMPVNGLGALTCLVFLLPSESGERVSYSITVMLSLAVFLTVTAEDLPKNSEPVPIMCLYILFNMIVCICALIIVILNLKLYHRSDSVKIARFYKALVRFSLCKTGRNKVGEVNIQSAAQFSDRTAPTLKPKGQMKSKIVVRSQAFESEYSTGNMDVDKKITWKEVSEAIDKFVFFGLIVLSYVPSIIILIYISAASDFVEQ